MRSRTLGKVIVQCQDLVIGYESVLTNPLNLVIERNEKVAIKGTNGLGKTTLKPKWWL